MKPFQELIKNFERTRGYARDFLIYGFKSRTEMDQKSSRTYDNERRRIEALLPQYVRSCMGTKGKKVSLVINPEGIEINPLYALLESKSFTQNDILLHYFIFDILQPGISITLNELADQLFEDYWQKAHHVPFPDVMTVRNKLNAYVNIGFLEVHKEGKSHLYSRSPVSVQSLEMKELTQLSQALSFFSNTLPLGVVAHWINDRLISPHMDSPSTSAFCFKHLFLFHALDDVILYEIVDAIRNQSSVEIHYESSKLKRPLHKKGIPLKVSSNLWHGRRFVHFLDPESNRQFTYRLDHIHEIKPVDLNHASGLVDSKVSSQISERTFSDAHQYSWSITPQKQQELEWLEMIIQIKDDSELYILHRLEREAHLGHITILQPHRFCYRAEVTDLNELVPWLRTWIGRIESIKSSNEKFIIGFHKDLHYMAHLYNEEDSL